MFFFSNVETASTLLYAHETTTAHLRSHSCFPDKVILAYVEILENVLTAGIYFFEDPPRLLGI